MELEPDRVNDITPRVLILPLSLVSFIRFRFPVTFILYIVHLCLTTFTMARPAAVHVLYLVSDTLVRAWQLTYGESTTFLGNAFSENRQQESDTMSLASRPETQDVSHKIRAPGMFWPVLDPLQIATPDPLSPRIFYTHRWEVLCDPLSIVL